MKKIALLSLFLAITGLFTGPKAQAQGYHPRVVNVCPVCRQYVYAYYQPVNCNGRIHYNWVTAQHTACMARQCQQPHYYPGHHIQYYQSRTPFYGYPSYYTPRYSGYLRPGISIRITR